MDFYPIKMLWTMNNPKATIYSFVCLISTFVCATLTGQTWTYDYPGSDLIEGEIQTTPDGGFLVPHTNYEGVYFKVNSLGQIQWTLSPVGAIEGEAVAALPDGTYAIAGKGNGSSIFLAKITVAGSLLWIKNYITPNNSGSYTKMVNIPGGGFFISTGDQFLAKTDDDGNLLWQKTSNAYNVISMVATVDGGVVFLSYLVPDVRMTRVDADGNILWTKNYGPGNEYGADIATASDGGFIAIGGQLVASGNSNIYIVKTDDNGNLQWEKSIGSALTEWPDAITPTIDGGYLVAGTSIHLQYLLKINIQGDSLWSRFFNDGSLFDVKETADGRIGLFGSHSETNDIQMSLVDAMGNFDQVWSGQPWQRRYPGTEGAQGEVVATSDGGFFASSWGSSAAFKADPNGIQQWTLALPDSLDGHSGGGVCLLPDGNYQLVGSAFVNTPSFHQYIFSAKVTPGGILLWLKLYPYAGSGNYGQSVAVAPDGSLFIGSPYNFLAKTDANGNLLWLQNSIGFSVKDLIATADGGVIFLLNEAVTGGPVMYLRKLDATGNFVWEKSLSASGGEYIGRSITATTDGGFALTGFLNLGNSSAGSADSDLLFMKFDADGNVVHQQIFTAPGVAVGADIDQTPDGGYIITGWQSVPVSRYTWLWRLDGQGNLLWEKDYFAAEGLSVKALADGGYIMLTNGLRLVRTDAQGSVFQQLIRGTIAEDINSDCDFQAGESGLGGWLVSAEGPFTAVAFTDVSGQYEIAVDTGSYQLSFSPPQLSWQPCEPNLNTSFNAGPETHDLGYLMAQAVIQTTSTISGYVFLDLDGDCIQDADEIGLAGCTVWASTEGNTGIPQWIAVTDANGFYSFTLPAGTDYYNIYLPNAPNNPYCQACNNPWLQFLNTTPLTHPIGVQCQSGFAQHLTGFVFYDENKNCLHDFDEPGLDGWVLDVVKIGTQDTFQIVGMDFPDGHFSVPVDTGNYLLTITPPNYLYLPCQYSYTTYISPLGAPPVYMPLMPLTQCPKLTVDIGTAYLSPCRSSVYHVQYCNEGTYYSGPETYIEVTFPPSLTVDSSEIPGMLLPGNSWRFSIGNVPKDSCGSFWINTFLNCDDPVGQSYCIEAHIYPDSVCVPENAQWDGSSVRLSADCMGDSVILTITNAGWGNMSQPLNFIVVEDNVLIRDSTFQLPSGGSTSLVVYPNGATIIMSAQQAMGHPGISMPVIFVEGCGDDSISLGFVTQYPQDDAESFVAIDCRESVGSFDPNTKSALPKGITDAHFIQNTTDLTYQISFQNLGNAPAETVIILDTLSQFLDTLRLQAGAASHPYQLELLPPNVLKFTFENIHLPPADLDYDASIGFVKFRVKQQPGNPPGTVIQNRADIYFDFNAPVITNTVTHRIPFPEMFINEHITICAGESWNDQVYTSDTLLVNTIQFAFFDSIFNTVIEVLPTITQMVDTTLVAAGMVFNVRVNADTSFVQSFIDDMGRCVERTVHVHVRTTSLPIVTENPNLSLAPNPMHGGFNLGVELNQGAFCTAKLLDSFGRPVLQLFDKEWIDREFSQWYAMQDLPAGVYFLVFTTDSQRHVLKLVAE